jgi:hypothetical protein
LENIPQNIYGRCRTLSKCLIFKGQGDNGGRVNTAIKMVIINSLYIGFSLLGCDALSLGESFQILEG